MELTPHTGAHAAPEAAAETAPEVAPEAAPAVKPDQAGWERETTRMLPAAVSDQYHMVLLESSEFEHKGDHHHIMQPAEAS